MGGGGDQDPAVHVVMSHQVMSCCEPRWVEVVTEILLSMLYESPSHVMLRSTEPQWVEVVTEILLSMLS